LKPFIGKVPSSKTDKVKEEDMSYQDLRDWIGKLEEAGQLKRITAEVDWNLELGAIARQVSNHQGPALLFERIKDYRDTPCRKLFANGLASRERVAMAFGLPKEVDHRGIVEFIKKNLGRRMDPVILTSGPVKEKIVKGDEVNLFKFPVPKYNARDGGRYINTFACTVTRDPDTMLMNVGIYRGMIGDNEKSISVNLLRASDSGKHFSKYEKMGKEMPVALVYGCDPVLLMCAGVPIEHPGFSEYEVAGGLRGEPVGLVKCETSDLYVPASAEIVVEGRISPDPETFQREGPFGEYTGFYSTGSALRPVIRVECITYRRDPIFRGGIVGTSPGRSGESTYWTSPLTAALIWKALEDMGVPGVTGVWGCPTTTLANLRVSIDNIFRGHAQRVAAALWSLNASLYRGKNLIVVDKDIDVFNDEAVEWAMAYRTNADTGDFQFFHGTVGSNLDPSIPRAHTDIMKYGGGRWTRVFVDATVSWDLEPQKEYGGRREPPLCTDIPVETAELIKRRWKDYGF
jgi:UbiD family decarboxylase